MEGPCIDLKNPRQLELILTTVSNSEASGVTIEFISPSDIKRYVTIYDCKIFKCKNDGIQIMSSQFEP